MKKSKSGSGTAIALVLLGIWLVGIIAKATDSGTTYHSKSYYSTDYSSSYGSSSSGGSSSYAGSSSSIYNGNEVLTSEQADALRGTGYHNTRPNSSAEEIELSAAQVKCETCGKHSDNGVNSNCDSCRPKYGN